MDCSIFSDRISDVPKSFIRKILKIAVDPSIISFAGGLPNREPEGFSSMKFFNLAIKEKVAFVPGNPFYINKEEVNTLRLNFSCVDEKTIETGVKRLGESIKKVLS